jgi:thioester reductase-like protein
MTVLPPPGRIGQRLVPCVIDELALLDPDRVLYSMSRTKDPAEGFQDVTARQFARMVDRCAWYIEENLGRGQNFPTLTYMGPHDIMFAVIIIASIKTGHKLLLNSPRNTLEAHLSLFEQTNCNTFLLPTDFQLPIAKKILSKRSMRVLDIHSLLFWGREREEVDKPYPYTKTFEEARLEPFVVMHTSGSTGLPKIVIMTHGTMAPLDAFSCLPQQGLAPTYPSLCAGKRVYSSFPLFHSAGVSIILPACIFAGFTVVLGPFPPSPETTNAMHVHGNVQFSWLPPTMLAGLAKHPEYLENLGKLNQICYGGGPCPSAVGDLVSQKTKLANTLGSTESGMHPIELSQHWAYMTASPSLGHEYRHVSDDLYEQVIVRRPGLSLYQGIFSTFPDIDEWHMRDLYSKHPTLENLWLYRGRLDDIIVFSTGEKLNPVDMEAVINGNALVSASLIAGQARFQSSLLVEPSKHPETDHDKEELMKSVLASVEQANALSPSHGRIHRNMIIFTLPDKPMLRAGKGTVQRQLTLDMYNTELAALYDANDRFLSDTVNRDESSRDVEEFVKTIINEATEIDTRDISTSADLFELGLDSLQVSVLERRMRLFLTKQGVEAAFDSRKLYANPTIAALTRFLLSLMGASDDSAMSEGCGVSMQTLIDLYGEDLPMSARDPREANAENTVVLLTGSTGSLGSYILDALQKNHNISRIYCLNRGPESRNRQEKSRLKRGLSGITDKVQCLDSDMTKAFFGLSRSDYKMLLNEVTHIIHNSWQVDFNLALDSFRGHVAGVRRLIDFSVLSRFRSQIFFVSSLSTVTGRPGQVAEIIQNDFSVSREMGYAQSKFVSEILLDRAAKESDVPAMIGRVGQIAGPVTEGGVWPKQEWVPSLISSSKYLGKLPSDLGQMEVVDWIPVDILAQSIVELATLKPENPASGAQVFHAVNPNRTSWSDLLPVVYKHLSQARPIDIVSLQDWIDSLRESASKIEDITFNPAVKLLGFYEDLQKKKEEMVQLETTVTVGMSPTMARLQPVVSGWMENWLRQWAF